MEYLGSGNEEIEWPKGATNTYYYEEYGYSVESILGSDAVKEAEHLLNIHIENTSRTLRFYFHDDHLYAIKDSIDKNSFFRIEEWSDQIPVYMILEIPEDYEEYKLMT
jgi:hypothetical protein